MKLGWSANRNIPLLKKIIALWVLEIVLYFNHDSRAGKQYFWLDSTYFN